jgi:hypothetical protein
MLSLLFHFVKVELTEWIFKMTDKRMRGKEGGIERGREAWQLFSNISKRNLYIVSFLRRDNSTVVT